jgi:hypothetical protein
MISLTPDDPTSAGRRLENVHVTGATAVLPSERTPEEVVSGVLEPGERILWVGRPDADSMSARERRRARLRRYGGTAILLGAGALLLDRVTPGLLDSLEPGVLAQPPVLVPVLIVLIVLPVLSVLGARRYARYARSLVYGLTDRRLLVIEGTEVVDERTPETASRVVLRQRGRDHADVVFGRRGTTHPGPGRMRDPVQREREIVAFKALGDAESVKSRIETWLAEHIRAAEAETGAAESVRTPPPVPAGAAVQPESEPGPDSIGRQVTLATPGLRVAFPASWRVRVRAKTKPQGRIFLDREDWRDPDEPGEWNVVRAEGPLRCSVEIEVFETRPTVTFESLSNSRIADAAAGPVAAEERNLQIGGLTGFAVTRRNDLNVDSRGTATVAAVVVLERMTVLHDGRRQVCARSTWPEDSNDLARAVDESIRSIRLD